MKRVAGLKTAAEELPSLGFRRSRVHRGPFRRQLSSSLKAPIGKGGSRVLPGAIAAKVLEEPAPHHLSDFSFVIRDQVFRDAPHDFRDLLLPLEIPVGHLDLAARQADYRGSMSGARRRHGQILNKRVKLV